MNKLKYFVTAIIALDLILVFPVMLSYQKVGEWFRVRVAEGGSPEVFVTLMVEITLLTVTAVLSYLVFRILKDTPFQSALYLIGWGVFLYGIGDAHILAWMYTGTEATPSFFGKAGSSIAHALGVGLGFALVILGLYKMALARKNIVSNEEIGQS